MHLYDMVMHLYTLYYHISFLGLLCHVSYIDTFFVPDLSPKFWSILVGPGVLCRQGCFMFHSRHTTYSNRFGTGNRVPSALWEPLKKELIFHAYILKHVGTPVYMHIIWPLIMRSSSFIYPY